MKRSSAASGLVAMALVAVLGGCAGESTSVDAPRQGGDRATDDTHEVSSEEAAPDFSFETFEGDTFSLAEQRGTPVVLNFWESW